MGIGLRKARFALTCGFAAWSLTAREQGLLGLPCDGFNRGALGQGKARDGIFCYRPEPTSLRAKRVFEQQRVIIELRLHLAQAERLWCGIARAALAYLGFDLIVFIFERADFLLERLQLRGIAARCDQLPLRFGIELLG